MMVNVGRNVYCHVKKLLNKFQKNALHVRQLNNKNREGLEVALKCMGTTRSIS
jgi:hypothetical protein